jgi:hypothetical protein
MKHEVQILIERGVAKRRGIPTTSGGRNKISKIKVQESAYGPSCRRGGMVDAPVFKTGTLAGVRVKIPSSARKECSKDLVCSSLHKISRCCPNAAAQIRAIRAEDPYESETDAYEPVRCIACMGVHMVNPKTGKVLGADDALNTARTDRPLVSR